MKNVKGKKFRDKTGKGYKFRDNLFHLDRF